METPDPHGPRTGPYQAVSRWLHTHTPLAGLCLLLGVTGATNTSAAGDPEALPEPQIKAAYILNFTRYASWPQAALADARAPLVLCVMGAGSGDIARQLQSRTAGSRPLELRTISRNDEAAACHAVYFGPSSGAAERARQAALLTRLRDLAVLTIGDSASFLADGGMINLMLVDGSIRFEVNLAAARQSGMGLNPRVLALAERVLGGGAR